VKGKGAGGGTGGLRVNFVGGSNSVGKERGFAREVGGERRSKVRASGWDHHHAAASDMLKFIAGMASASGATERAPENSAAQRGGHGLLKD